MRKLLVFAVLIFTASILTAQQPTLQQKLQTEGDISTQFQLLLSQSRNMDSDFKLIRRSNVEIIQRNVADSLATYKKEIVTLKNMTSTSGSTIQSLQDSVTSLANQLHTEKQKTASIGFLGIDFNKGAYHTMVWSIIAILGVALFIIIISFRKAKVDAIEHRSTADEAQNELHVFKKKAMEKEQQLKRQLLDEQLKRNS
jgi:hypothetical protein